MQKKIRVKRIFYLKDYQFDWRGGRSSRGRASFTLRLRPAISLPFMDSIALFASSASSIVTKPKPLERPELRSEMIEAFSTFPNAPNASDRS